MQVLNHKNTYRLYMKTFSFCHGSVPAIVGTAAVFLFSIFTAACSGTAPAVSLPEKSLPAPCSVMSEGLLGNIAVDGWIEEFLERQASGLTGHPDALSYPYNSCLWAGEIRRNTESYGCEWWRYEQTAYYTDGLLRTGYFLGREDFVEKCIRGIDHSLAHADESGRIGSHIDSPELAMWPVCVWFRVLQAYYEKTGDRRIVDALHRHYLTYKVEEVETWRAIVSIEGMLWVYGKTGDSRLLDLCETAWNAGKHGDLTTEECMKDSKLYMHGVTCCEELKLPVLLYAYTGKRQYLEQALNAQRRLERDDMLPDGVIASAEALVGNGDVRNSHETCDIADYTWTLGYFLMATGEARWADKIEKAVFNACPGAITKDFRSLQYFSSVNQVTATGDSNHNGFFHGSTWMAYRPTHETECCSGNVHRIMPDYASRMWMMQGRDTLVAALYGPSEIVFENTDGKRCRIVEDTDYPFGGNIVFRFGMEERTRVPFSFRIPEWSSSVSVRLNGKAVKGDFRRGSFAVIDRKFRDGDRIELDFGMEAECVPFGSQGVYFMRGPLVYSYAVPQKKEKDGRVYANMNGKVPEEEGFDCWSFTPDGDWNFAWAGRSSADIKTVSGGSGDGYPFDKGQSPVCLEIPARQIAWELEDGRYTPSLPRQDRIRTLNDSLFTLRLVPYGSTELRVTVFPSLMMPARPVPDVTTFVQTDAMHNILPDTEVPPMEDDTLRVARGENAVAQFVLDASEELSGLEAEVSFTGMPRGGRRWAKKMAAGCTAGWVRYVRSDHHYCPAAPDSLRTGTGLYPDPIITDCAENVPAGGRALLWVDIPVVQGTAPGTYAGRVTVTGHERGGEFTVSRDFSLRVYPAETGSRSLFVTNWFFTDKFPFMNNGRDVEYGSPEYWECFRSLVGTASDYGQNVWIVYDGPQPVARDGKLEFDYTRFDREVEFLLDNVEVRRIEGNHVAYRSHSRWADPFWVEVYRPDGKGGLVSERLPHDAPEVKEYLTGYFSSLQAHLKSRKLADGRTWLDIYMQHIADEPVDENIDTWEGLARIIREASPEIRIIEAYRAHRFNPELIDVIVPQLDELKWDSYADVPQENELWYYTCMYPRANYANRYVSIPLMKSRLLHWINWRYDVRGFLHWGFNWWGGNGDPSADVSAPSSDWPGGDAYIVYPGYRKVYPSIRLAAMRDGLGDFELLKAAAQYDSAGTAELAASIIRGYDDYETSVARFREVRRQLLETASLAGKVKTSVEQHGSYSVLKQDGGKSLGFSPDSGVELIHDGGFAFKDLNRNGVLDPYEDWRLADTVRAGDLASKLPVEKIAGLMLYSMHQAVPTDSVGFWSSTYNGMTLDASGLPHSAISDRQKQFLEKDNLRAVLVVRVESPGIAAEWNNGLQRYAEGLDFGIPVNISSDPRHETRAWAEFNAGAGGRISLWPTSIGLAATFDPGLVRGFGEIASREYRAMGISTALSPQIDIATEPRWSRFGGTFGEDPALSADMARAYIDGFQTSSGEEEISDGWGFGSVNCMVKHWPGGGSEEGGRDAHYSFGKFCVYPDSNFSDHLIPFLDGAFKLDGKTASASAVMPYYTISYGIDPSGQNRGNGFSSYIVNDLLRRKYGYDGVVCTDWGVTHDCVDMEESSGKCWGVEKLSEAERHYEALKAGVDQFGGNNVIEPLMAAYGMWEREFGAASARERFESSARRLLLNMFRLGLFENPYTDPSAAEKTVGCAEFTAAGLEAQRKSVVMLKNSVTPSGKRALPVKGKKRVYIPKTSETEHLDLQVVAKYFEVVPTAGEADFALVMIGEPEGGQGYSLEDRAGGGNGYVPISLQYGEYTASMAREHSIAGGDPLENFTDRSYRGKSVTSSNSGDAEVVRDTKRELGGRPVVTVVHASRPFVPGEIEPFSDALLISFGVQYSAVLDIVGGRAEPSAMLPMQLPADMAAVEMQSEDSYGDMECYRDSDGNVYDFAFGLGWKGQIRDGRYSRYCRQPAGN